MLQEGAGRIRERTLLILDISDIAKPYAEKMQYLARVRDGSSGEIADGYWLCQVVAVENEDNAIVPLYSTLYSQRAPDFVSENAELKTAMAASPPPARDVVSGLSTAAVTAARSTPISWPPDAPSSSARRAIAICAGVFVR